MAENGHCGHCGGSGQDPLMHWDGKRYVPNPRPCTQCGGSGRR